MVTRPTIYVVDDDTAVRQSLSRLIRTMQMQVKCFESAASFLDGFSPNVHGCVIVDFRMPGMNGLELQRTMLQEEITLPVIIVTGHGDIPLCVQAMKYGAVDFLEKPFRATQLKSSIQNAIRIDQQRRAPGSQDNLLQARFALLSNQEHTVLNGIVSGKPIKEIATELDISLRTVHFRRASLMRKLNVESRVELIQLVTSNTAAANV